MSTDQSNPQRRRAKRRPQEPGRSPMPPRAKKKKSGKRTQKNKPASGKRNRTRSPDTANVIVGILCLVHGGGALFSVINLLFEGRYSFSWTSLPVLLGWSLSALLAVAGIGILTRSEWSISLAEKSALGILALAGLSLIFSLPHLPSILGTLGIKVFGDLLLTIVKSLAIPSLVIWWSMQDPRL